MRTLALVAIAALLTGCGGGGSTLGLPALPTGSPATQPTQQKNQNVSVSFKIVVPTASGAAARRVPDYVSASTKSATIAVGSATATTVNCTTTCSGTVSAPVGSETFAVNLYDAANGSGNLLSTGTVTQTIVANTANSVNLTFNGVVASLSIALSESVTSGTAATVGVAVDALDADGNTIVGPGIYVDASGTPVTIALSDSDTSGATTLSQTSITQPTTGITLAYDGAAITSVPAISASATDLTTAQAVLHGTEAYAYTGSAQSLTIPSGLTSVTIAAAGAAGAGGCFDGASGANGGAIEAVLPLAGQGETLAVYVGGDGSSGGFNGGGTGGGCGNGGGASDVRAGSNDLSNRIIVAGGGGGGGDASADCAPGVSTGAGSGGAGGAANAVSGGNAHGGGNGGGGGTQSAGGAAGASVGAPPGASGGEGFGGGGAASEGCAGSAGAGSGGGGYYGGGGGGSGYDDGGGGLGSGGGGGSSYAEPGASILSNQQGVNSGNGSVTITW